MAEEMTSARRPDTDRVVSPIIDEVFQKGMTLVERSRQKI